MQTHTIYHIPGKKVGATKDFERRKSEYPVGTEFEILMDDLDGLTPKQVGDWEWWWADYLGYERGRYYGSIINSGSKPGVPKPPRTPEHCAAISKVKTGVSRGKMRDEWKTAIALAHIGLKHNKVTCPHCGKIGGNNIMPRYHFDKCKMAFEKVNKNKETDK